MDDLVDRKLLAEMRGWVPLSLRSDGIGCPRSTVCRNAPIPAAHLARPLPTPPIAQARTPRGASRRREHERKRREGARRRRRRPLLDGAQAGASVLPPRDRRPPRVSARATSQPRSPLPRRFINLLAVPRSPTSPQGAVERELVGVKSASARKDLELAAEKKLTRDLRARLDATLDKLDDALALPAGSSVSSDLALAAAEDETRDLRARLAAALSENASLKRFLKDYGMTWVGDDDEARAPPAARKVRSNRLEARAKAARGEKKPSGRRSSDASTSASTDASTSSASTSSASTSPSTSSASTSPSSSREPFSVDVSVVERSIKQLNAVAGEGKGSVVTGPGGERRLEMPRAKVFVLYADGFEVDDGPFRGFDDARNRDFVVDLRDGYFPYEMKETHPDGVPFTLVDRSSEEYSKRREKTRQKKTGGDRKCGKSFEAFTGGGARLDGGAVTEGKKAKGAAEVSERLGGKKSREGGAQGGASSRSKDAAFLAKIPPVVVRDGRVIEVRKDLERAMGGSRGDGASGGTGASASRRVLETTVSRGCFRRLLEEDRVRSSSDPAGGVEGEPPLETATLRVKGVDGGKMYVLTLHPDDTVGKLRRYLAEALRGEEAGASSRAFEIRNAYPPRVFDDDRTTLREAGLAPNATLLLRAV